MKILLSTTNDLNALLCIQLNVIFSKINNLNALLFVQLCIALHRIKSILLRTLSDKFLVHIFNNAFIVFKLKIVSL
jgi:hypothetical protein